MNMRDGKGELDLTKIDYHIFFSQAQAKNVKVFIQRGQVRKM